MNDKGAVIVLKCVLSFVIPCHSSFGLGQFRVCLSTAASAGAIRRCDWGRLGWLAAAGHGRWAGSPRGPEPAVAEGHIDLGAG